MAEPKKETVRIALPPRPETAGSTQNEAKRDTARIVLPSRTPVTPIRRLPPNVTPLPAAGPAPEAPSVLPRRPPVITPVTSPMLQPLPKPPGIENESDSNNNLRPVPPLRDESAAARAVNRGPKQETARINILPRPTPVAPPAINMTKTQPLLVQPAATAPVAPVVITSRPIVPLETIPRPLCWALVGISAVIFLIQIWNYVVS
jgi:thioredoxin 1